MNLPEAKRPKPLPSTQLLGGGTPMCAGCGGLAAIQEIRDILGARPRRVSKPSLHKLTETLMI